jgi:hypothetical protein
MGIFPFRNFHILTYLYQVLKYQLPINGDENRAWGMECGTDVAYKKRNGKQKRIKHCTFHNLEQSCRSLSPSVKSRQFRSVTAYYGCGQNQLVMCRKMKAKKKRATKATLSIIRVHLLVLLLPLGVRGVTPYS